MDRTLLYRELVRLANPGADSVIEPHDAADAVSAECVGISRSIAALRAQLSQARGQYLAASGRSRLSDKQRDDIDYDVQNILQLEHAKIRKLEEVEQRRALEKPRGLHRLLADPALEGAKKTLSAHRKGMFIYLNRQLEEVSAEHMQQQRIRLARHAGRRKKPAAWKPAPKTVADLGVTSTPNTPSAESTATPAVDPPTGSADSADPAGASGSQALLLEENSSLMAELQATLDQAEQAERSMREISAIQTELSTHLASQTEMISHLADDAFRTSGDVGGANVQLEQAKTRNRRASKMVIYGAVGIGVLLLTYDAIL